MARTIVQVVKVVAPIALQALAESAANLLSGTKIESQTEFLKSESPQDDGSIISRDTAHYNNLQFSVNYRYFYKGTGSTPPAFQAPIIGAAEDIIVWNPVKNETSDVKAYLQTIFKDTLSDDDTIEVSDVIGDLFTARFKEPDLSWTPLNKRFNLSSGVTIDLQMVTSAGYDQDKNPLGVAAYCFVAYKTKS
jgi:hypothetical protein